MKGITDYINVLKDHGYQQDEALILLMRLQLIKIINTEIRRRQWSQREAAKILAVAQPRVAELSAMATEKFSVEILVKFLHRLGLKAALTISPSKHYVKPRRLAPKKAMRSKTLQGGAAIKN